MGDASRSELSNPGLRGPTTKRAPGRPVRPYTARSASLRGRPPLTTSGAVRRSAHIQASEPKCAHLVIRTTPVASPRELSHPTQSTTRPTHHAQHAPQVLALAPLALGFAPAAQQRAPTALNGYVPKGLTEAQYKAAVGVARRGEVRARVVLWVGLRALAVRRRASCGEPKWALGSEGWM